MQNATELIAGVFRQESGRILAGLIRRSGSFERAEEALQEAFTLALERWPEAGAPANPAAWLTTVAQRKLVDGTRKEKTRRNKADELRYEIERLPSEPIGWPIAAEAGEHFPDERLRLLFTCCHPAIEPRARVALTLRTLGGLSTPEIARAFLLPEPTLAQ